MRIRIRFTKLGKIRFTSHRDVARIWERALRRAELPVARNGGFSPRPKLHFGLALSTGYESLAEYLDVDVVEGAQVDVASLAPRFTAALPVGLAATAVAVVAPGTRSLQHSVTSSRWEIDLLGVDLSGSARRTEALLASPTLVMTRQRKGADVTEDVRANLLSLQAVAPIDGGTRLVAELGTQTRGLRPSELITLLGDDVREGHVCRTHQFTEHDGVRSEPLTPGDQRPVPLMAVAATPTGPTSPAPHAQVRAS